MTELIAGIDLGTTNSVIAVVENGKPRVIPIDGQPTMPSCVGLSPTGELLVGIPARNQLVAAPHHTIFSVKRRMGEETVILLGDRSFRPEEISALILAKLKDQASAALGRPIRKAVITVPAFFDEKQRKATQDAGVLAGLEVVRIINEPTAAALAYNAGSNQSERVLVYDLGGGTFDVSVVTIEEGVVEVRASHGDTHLGGDDFDQVLVQHAVDHFHAEHEHYLNEDAATARRLKVVLEQAKCRLSDEVISEVQEDYVTTEHHLHLDLMRPEYEKMIEPYLRKTLDCVQAALQDARMQPAELDRIMLVGGATRTPLVHRMLEEGLGLEPRFEIDPDLIVALGAAIQGARMAGELIGSVLVDITTHTLGLEVLEGYELACSPIIRRNTPLPCVKSELYATVAPGQTEVQIRVLEGESRDPEENRLLHEFVVSGLDREADAHNPVIVRFALDVNGMLNVTAIEKETGLQKTVQINTRDRNLLNLAEARENISEFLNSSNEPEFAGEHAALRQRAQALLSRNPSEEDASEIRRLLSQLDQPGKAEKLSDILFYLED